MCSLSGKLDEPFGSILYLMIIYFMLFVCSQQNYVFLIFICYALVGMLPKGLVESCPLSSDEILILDIDGVMAF